ncbi:MAG: patatin-like phospholipase family protein, partial [Bacteroidota bacterium]
MFNFSKSIKIGLALSGGGARAHVHLGMMQALLEKGFHFDVITGTSAGSLIGGLYANGYSPPEILEISQATDFTRLARFALSWSGLLKLDSARKYLKKYLPETFEELQKPFIAAGTNMSSNQVSYLEKGPLIDAIL